MLKTRKVGPGFKQAAFSGPSSIDVEARTVSLVWSTGASVLRSDVFGQFNELLSMDPKHVDLTRLKKGAPLLASHNTGSLNAILGVVESVSLSDGIGTAKVRFASDPESDAVFTKVREGIIKNVSIGYQIRKMVDRTKKGEKIPTYEAVDWAPYEISLVTVPADPTAQIRNQENKLTEVEILQQNSQGIKMSEENRTPVQEEKQRQNEIRRLVRGVKLEETFADELCDQEITLAEARERILAKVVEAQPIQTQRRTPEIEVRSTQEDRRREVFTDAILHRVDPKNFNVTENGKHLFGRSLIEQAKFIIPQRTLESDATYATRVMSNSDLPLLLANVAEKSLQKSYELAAASHRLWTKSDTVRNYKEFSEVAVSDFPALLPRSEGEEFKEGSVSDKNETVQLGDYGRIVSFTSQSIVNDDLGALQKLSVGGGLASARLDNKLAYSALMTNKTMKDNVTLYHADHNNLGTAGVIGETTVAEAFTDMMQQKSVGDVDYLNLLPKYLICGPAKMVEAKKFLASINATQSSNVNVFSGSLQLVVDPEITGNQYYFAADPNQINAVVLYRLEGQEKPIIQSRVKFETNSLQLKIAYAAVAAPMDWRGLYKNAGN